MQTQQWKVHGMLSRQTVAMLAGIAMMTMLLLAGSAGAAYAQAAAPPDTTITIRTTGSNLQFTPDRISAKEGTRVRIRYVNEGTLPHNIVLVKDEDDIDLLGQAALDAKDTGYVPLEYRDRMIAYSTLATPGETVEITFEVPPAGEYFFVCLYSGHYNMMFGTMRSLRN